MVDNHSDAFDSAFTPGPRPEVPAATSDPRTWDAPPVEPTVAAAAPSFNPSEPAPESRRRGRGSKAPAAAKPSKAELKAAKQEASKTKAPKQSRKERQAAEVRAKAVDKKSSISLGQRYGGNRKYWLLLSAALVLSPVLSLTSLAVGGAKANKSDIAAAVDQALKDRGSNFPTGQAVMWSGQVVRTWGTWDSSDQTDQRSVLLSQYLSRGLDPSAGWNGAGKQEVLYSTVNPVPTIVDANHAWVDASYQIQDGTWRCVSLPIYAYHPKGFTSATSYAFALTANPVPVACAPRTGAPTISSNQVDAAGKPTSDDQVSGQKLQTEYFPGFFAAWAASDQATLKQYATNDAELVGLGGAFDSTPAPTINEVHLPLSNGAKITSGQTYTATVSVTWTVAGSTAQLTSWYDVKLRNGGNQWFVTGEPTPVEQQTNVGGSQAGDISTPQTGDKANLWTTPKPTAPTAEKTTSPTADGQ
ncbi:hypothetical protein GCM10025867_46720 (plasmid) [Frondihabitans sucicola]|uniref:Conjugal transfer protein n=1 Tax=Frondihabitans sucicola TaxID=1268041 RepID=A0ABN6Y5X7_9MICO|nr:conjugal transfer protein [Frondihabitans sucicola]BDZ52431.1 hypothetical protein GCM10025867_46720 [Frondihabitans sucicola]